MKVIFKHWSDCENFNMDLKEYFDGVTIREVKKLGEWKSVLWPEEDFTIHPNHYIIYDPEEEFKDILKEFEL